MRSGSVGQGTGRGPARRVPQSDGYAEHVDPMAEPYRPTGPGQHRSARRAAQSPTRSIPAGSYRITGVSSLSFSRGQRPIRTTIAWLLVLPLVTMAGLYAYAVSGTIGPAIAKQNAATVNADIGAPEALMLAALQAEQSDTFVWQASHHLAPKINLQKDYAATDAAVRGFQSGLAKAQGALAPTAKAEVFPLLRALATRVRLRAEVQAGTTDGLAVFEGYLAMAQPTLTFTVGLANPDASTKEFQQSELLIDAAVATDDMVDIAAMLGGVIAGGGYMTPAEYQLFETLYNDQVSQFNAVNHPLLWQVSPDPYWQSSLGPGAMSTPQVHAVHALEQLVRDDGSNRATVRLPLTAARVQDTFGQALAPTGPLLTAENAGRLGITANDNHDGDLILWRLGLVGGGGLLVVILSAFLLLRFSNRITRELTGLRNAARTLSGERLPSVVRRLRAGDDVDVAAEAPPLELKTRTREVTDTADAFSAVQLTAIEAAVEQATLRKGVSNVFRSLARRNQSLIQRQLRMLDEMERATQDPDALSQLFRLDHLTTRMRRQAEGLIILSGSAPGRRWRQPVPVVEVLRGAISEIEDYVRVDLAADFPDYLTGSAVADVTHLLAELIENAVVYSPPATRVQVRGGRVANGYVIEVEDRGLGMPPAARDQLNDRLANPPDFDLTDSDQLGLFVVSRLAIRNQINVSLRESRFGGTTAIVLLPDTFVVSEEEARVLAAQGARGALAAGFRPTDSSGAAVVPGPARRGPWFNRLAGANEPDMRDSYAVDAYGGPPLGAHRPYGGDSFVGGRSSGGSSFGSSSPGGTGSASSGTAQFYSGGATNGGGPADYVSPGNGGSFGGDSFAGHPAADDSFGNGPSPSTGGGRGAFGNPAPFQDGPSQPAASAAGPPFGVASDGGDQWVGTSSGGLPRRQKMASLTPHMRQDRSEAPKGPNSSRSPEQARALLSSIQRGLRTGRDRGASAGSGAGDQDGPPSGDDSSGSR